MTTQLPLPKERLERTIEQLEHFATNLKWTNVGGAQTLLFAADGFRALQAAYEQEPVMYVMAGEDFDTEATSTSKSTVDAWVEEWNAVGEPVYKTVPLYTHPAPSIPTVSFYRDGIVAAAKWVDAQREAYDNEHGHRDPDTGTFEFGNDAQREYSSTLADIADGIRALHPNAASEPSIPAAVPDYFAGLVAEARVRADKAMRKFPQPNYVLNKVAEESGEVIKAVIHYTEGREEWENVEGEIIDNLAMLLRLVTEGDQVIGFAPPEALRASMLQAEPDGRDYRAIVERIAEIMHGSVTDVDLLTVTVLSMKQKADRTDWISVSERLPKPNTYVQVSNGAWVGLGAYNDSEHLDDDEHWQDEHHEFINLLHHPVTHWQPLPALPKV